MRWPWVFDSLQDRARKTHESYATYVALLVVGNGKVAGIVEPSHEYFGHVSRAIKLVDGLRTSYFKYHALTSVARVCMQPHCLDSILAIGLERFRPSDLRFQDYPDARLDAVRRIASEEFWQAAVERAASGAQPFPGWEGVQNAERENAAERLSLPREDDPLSLHLMVSFYDQLAQELRIRGMDSLTFNGHQQYTQRLVEATDSLAPFERSNGPVLRAVSSESDEEVVIVSFERERLVLAEKPFRSSIHPFSEVPTHRRSETTAGTGKDEHIFLVSRMPTRLLQQYGFPDADRAALSASPHEPLLLLRRSAVASDGERVVEHFLMEHPDELHSLIAAFDGDMPTVANLSLTTLTNEAFVRRWFGVLRRYATLSILFDCSPFARLRAWARQNSFDVCYATINLHIDGVVRSVFACRPRSGESPVFLVPCSEALNSALNYYVQEVVNPRERFKNELACVTEDAWSLQIALGHLFREEPFFDCTTISS